MLKERLCFDPEFWNLLTIRTHCLELISDKVMKAAVLNEMEEEEKEYSEGIFTSNCLNDSCAQSFNLCQCTEAASIKQCPPEEQTVDGEAAKSVPQSNNAVLKKQKWRRRLRRRKHSASDDEVEPSDDPEFKYNLKSTSSGNKPVYSLRRNHTRIENSASAKLPLNRKREYLSRCVKSQILKRKGQKKRWLQGLSRPEQAQTVKEKVKVKGKKRGRKPLARMELSYPDNEILLTENEPGFEENGGTEDKEQDMPHLEIELEQNSEHRDYPLDQTNELETKNELGKPADLVSLSSPCEQTQEESQRQLCAKISEDASSEPQAAVVAVEGDPELDGPPLELLDCPIELLHSYSLKSRKPDSEKLQPEESSAPDELNGDAEDEPQPTEETKVTNVKVSYLSGMYIP